ncbi:MAG: hypothetical protein ABFQ64_00115 [Campylobacterota bacterium]
MEKNSINKIILFIFVLQLFHGCAVVGYKEEYGGQLDVKKFKNIKLNEMSKQEVIDVLGPPTAIARKNGSVMYIPNPSTGSADAKQPEVFLELFSMKQTLGEEYMVYYYHSITQSGLDVAILLPIIGHGSSETTFERLWILINERTKKVEDYIFKEEK